MRDATPRKYFRNFGKKKKYCGFRVSWCGWLICTRIHCDWLLLLLSLGNFLRYVQPAALQLEKAISPSDYNNDTHRRTTVRWWKYARFWVVCSTCLMCGTHVRAYRTFVCGFESYSIPFCHRISIAWWHLYFYLFFFHFSVLDVLRQTKK